MKPLIQNGVGVLAAEALVKVMSDNTHGRITIAIGPPAYDPHSATLYLPGIPTGDIAPETQRDLRAFLGHEAAERGLSTWDPRDKRWWDARTGMNGWGRLVNALNDVRINHLQAEVFPGWGLQMKEVVSNFYEKLLQRNAIKPLEPSVMLVGNVLVYIGEGQVTWEQALLDLPQLEPWMARIEDIARDVDFATETEASLIDLAGRIWERLKEDQTQQQPSSGGDGSQSGDGKGQPQEGQKGKGGQKQQDPSTGDEQQAGTLVAGQDDQGDDSQGGGGAGDPQDAAQQGGGGAGDPSQDGGDQGKGSGADDGQGDDAPAQDDGTDQGQGDGDSGVNHAPDGLPGLQDSSYRDVDDHDELLQDIVKALFGGRLPTVDRVDETYTYDPRWDVVEVVSEHGGVAMNRAEYAREGQVLATKLRQALTVPAPRPHRYKPLGLVDERRIAALATGDRNIMQQRVIKEADDIACAASFDLSSSMKVNGKLDVAKRLCYVWNEALGQLNIPLAVYGWSTVDTKPGHNPNVYRQSKLLHTVYKDFRDRWNDQRTLRRLNRMKTAHYTPTGEGLLFAAERLAQRPERRKVLFLFTDGKPVLTVKQDSTAAPHNNFIQLVQQRCKRAGIEVVWVGIMDEDVREHAEHFIIVDDVTKLRSKAADELVKVLREGRMALLKRR